jgi:hypothetical protein
MEGQKVVITTEWRGVFFGELESHDEATRIVKLRDVRMCVSWDVSRRGVLGLASHGPSAQCRISHATPAGTFYGVTAVLPASREAVEKWETAPWSG